jgi:aminotransferase
MTILKKQTSPYTSKCVNNLAPSGIRKFFDLVANMEGVISLGVGEPDYVTPWHIREAAIYAIEKGYTMYTSNAGMPELREEIARYLSRHSQLNYKPENEILITVGVSEALDLAMRAILDPGDEVIMADPSYVSYSACVCLAGGIPVLIPTRAEDNFELRAENISPLITPKTKAILLGYPANPTGAMMSKEKLTQISELALKRNILVISDEIYGRLVYGMKEVCFASLPGMQEHTILLSGFSKAYAMTGWRLGFAAGNKEIITAMTKIHQYTMLCAPIVAQKAAIEALKFGEPDVQEMVADYNRRRLVMFKGLNSLGLNCFEPRGAFYAFPSVKASGLNSEDFSEKLLYEEKVVVVPGTAFGSCGEGYVRCCYATSLPEIEEALIRIKKFLTRHRD